MSNCINLYKLSNLILFTKILNMLNKKTLLAGGTGNGTWAGGGLEQHSKQTEAPNLVPYHPPNNFLERDNICEFLPYFYLLLILVVFI